MLGREVVPKNILSMICESRFLLVDVEVMTHGRLHRGLMEECDLGYQKGLCVCVFYREDSRSGGDEWFGRCVPSVQRSKIESMSFSA